MIRVRVPHPQALSISCRMGGGSRITITKLREIREWWCPGVRGPGPPGPFRSPRGPGPQGPPGSPTLPKSQAQASFVPLDEKLRGCQVTWLPNPGFPISQPFLTIATQRTAKPVEKPQLGWNTGSPFGAPCSPNHGYLTHAQTVRSSPLVSLTSSSSPVVNCLGMVGG